MILNITQPNLKGKNMSDDAYGMSWTEHLIRCSNKRIEYLQRELQRAYAIREERYNKLEEQKALRESIKKDIENKFKK